MSRVGRILCVGTTPALQRVMVFNSITSNAVNRAVQTHEVPAGKSVNVAKVLHALGLSPAALGFLGGLRGGVIRSNLAMRGIETLFLETDAPTRECVTVLDLKAQTQTELVEESAPLPPALFGELLELIKKHVGDCHAVVLSGTVAPGGPRDFYSRCVRIANDAGVLSVLDAQGAALMESLPAGPGLVKPNRGELGLSVGTVLRNESDVCGAMRQLVEAGARQVVVTAGREPVIAFDGRTFWRITPPNVEVRNPIGSGDSFTAAMVARMAGGDDFEETCRWGAAAGSANALTILPGELDADVLRGLVKKVLLERLPGGTSC